MPDAATFDAVEQRRIALRARQPGPPLPHEDVRDDGDDREDDEARHEDAVELLRFAFRQARQRALCLSAIGATSTLAFRPLPRQLPRGTGSLRQPQPQRTLRPSDQPNSVHGVRSARAVGRASMRRALRAFGPRVRHAFGAHAADRLRSARLRARGEPRRASTRRLAGAARASRSAASRSRLAAEMRTSTGCASSELVERGLRVVVPGSSRCSARRRRLDLVELGRRAAGCGTARRTARCRLPARGRSRPNSP